MDNATTFTAPEKRYFNTPEVISFLKEYAGLTFSKSTIFKMSMRQSIPCRRGPSNRLLFPVQEVKAWVDNGGKIETEG
jgi:hypothetical protein